MDYLIKQQDILDLKMEDNSDQYLFNSLLGIGDLNQQSNPYDEVEAYSFLDRQNPSNQKSNMLHYQQTIIHQLSHLYNLRMTPLNDLMTYVQQVYEPSETVRKSLFWSLKKYKLQLKRENAKKRNPQTQRHEEIVEEVKLEENLMSEFGFEDESQETKKKKRNRMSAQKSRDRKKEYIKQIQKINKDLKKRIEEVNQKNSQRVKPASRDFLKVLLCLGITCFLNTSPHTTTISQQVVQEERPSTETISTYEAQWLPTQIEQKLDLEACKKMLPSSQQKMLEDALLAISQSQEVIHIQSTPSLEQDDEEDEPSQPPFTIVHEKGRPKKLPSKRSASSCSTP